MVHLRQAIAVLRSPQAPRKPLLTEVPRPPEGQRLPVKAQQR